MSIKSVAGSAMVSAFDSRIVILCNHIAADVGNPAICHNIDLLEMVLEERTVVYIRIYGP